MRNNNLKDKGWLLIWVFIGLILSTPALADFQSGLDAFGEFDCPVPPGKTVTDAKAQALGDTIAQYGLHGRFEKMALCQLIGIAFFAGDIVRPGKFENFR